MPDVSHIVGILQRDAVRRAASFFAHTPWLRVHNPQAALMTQQSRSNTLDVAAKAATERRSEPTDSPRAMPAALGPVIGIGASAGGPNAFKAFLTSMPAQSGITFVLVQHLRSQEHTDRSAGAGDRHAGGRGRRRFDGRGKHDQRHSAGRDPDPSGPSACRCRWNDCFSKTVYVFSALTIGAGVLPCSISHP